MQSRIVVFAFLATLLGASPADADGLAAAELLLMQEKDDLARAALHTWLGSDAELDSGKLQTAVFMARYLEDIDLLRRTRTVGEALEQTRPEDKTLAFALGCAYLGLAEENLRRQTGSRSISLYFADAEARAKAEHPLGPLLAAEARYAQGDLKGALERLGTDRRAQKMGADDDDAYYRYVGGRYWYEHAASLPVDAQGRPSDEAQQGFAVAVAWLTSAVDDARALFPRRRRQALLWRAYCRHRTGHVDLAEADYMAAFAEDKKSGPLVLRGLASLYMRRTQEFPAALDRLAARGHHGPKLTDLRVGAHLSIGSNDRAMYIAQAWRAKAKTSPAAWLAVGRALWALKRLDEAHRSHMRALQIDPAYQGATRAIEVMARQAAAEDFDRCETLYEDLLRIRPRDPYIRNNYGFLLREYVSPFTELLEGGIQRLKADAPPPVLGRLERCVSVYREAAAAIDESEDGNREELAEWNLAGIVNDYGLMLHYFADVQDAALAEQQYLRVMRMTDYTFKDTYSPNLHRLYRYVLKNRLLAWYRAAREARTAVLREAAGADGRMTLVPDERKRAAAQRDLDALWARILRELKTDAEEDGKPWPPGPDPLPSGKEDENDR